MSSPGSPEAVAKGCTCAIMDNGYGRGYKGQPNVFLINVDCKIHGNSVRKMPTKVTVTVPCIECGDRNDNALSNFPTCSKCINDGMVGGAD